jgi:flagellar hook-associated protein 3 FlgL
MRISTSNLFQAGLARMTDLQSSLAKIQLQLSTNKRVVTPSDDPVASSRALTVTAAKGFNERLSQNRGDARSALGLEDNALASVTTLLQNVKTAIVQAGNGALSDNDRQSIATSLRGQLDDLIGLANSQDGEGNYMFAGYQNTTQPFVASAGGAQYMGDQGSRMLQVGQSRQFSITDPGDAIFVNVPATNAYVTVPAATNTGTGVVTQTAVADSTQLKSGHSYSIDISGGGTLFSVYDLTTDPTKTTPLPMSGAYVSGQKISIDGLQVTLTGAPADGDTFTVRSGKTQDVFTTLNNLVDLLSKPVQNATDRTNLNYGLQTANTNIDNALNNVLTVRSSVGARLNELDALDSMGDNLGLEYESTLETLTGLDMAKAITDLTMQKTALEAAQQSYVKVTGLSLFNFIGG